MRSIRTCPKCAGQKFAVTEEYRQATPCNSDASVTVAAITVALPASAGVLEWAQRRCFGQFEAWICLHCGYTEFYARDLPRNIEEIIKQHADQWRVVDATPPEQGPYR